MKKIILFILLIFTTGIFGQSAISRSPLWYMSGATTINPLSSTWSLSGVTNITYTGQILAPNGSAAAPAYSFSTDTDMGFYRVTDGNLAYISGSSVERVRFVPDGIELSGESIFWGTAFGSASRDVQLTRDAPNVLALKRTTNAQTFRLYDEDNTASNDRYTNIGWLADSSFVIDLDISGSKTQRPMSFTGFTSYTFDNSITGTFGATSKLLLDGSTTGHTDTAGLLDINMSPTAAATGTVMADLALTSPSAGFGATTHYGINLSFTGDSDDNASSIVQLIQMGFTPNSSPTTVYGLYGNDSDLDYFIFEDGGAPSRFDGNVTFNAGIFPRYLSGALTDGAPTDAEIDGITGSTPAGLGAGYMFLIKDTDGSGLIYEVISDGTAWQYKVLTIAL